MSSAVLIWVRSWPAQCCCQCLLTLGSNAAHLYAPIYWSVHAPSSQFGSCFGVFRFAIGLTGSLLTTWLSSIPAHLPPDPDAVIRLACTVLAVSGVALSLYIPYVCV